MLTRIKVPKCHDPYSPMADNIILHTFVDASKEAFSAVSYFRIEVGQKIIRMWENKVRSEEAVIHSPLGIVCRYPGDKA